MSFRPIARVVIREFQRHKVPLHMDLEMPTIEAIRKMVERNEGVAFLPRMCVEEEIRHGMLLRSEGEGDGGGAQDPPGVSGAAGAEPRRGGVFEAGGGMRHEVGMVATQCSLINRERAAEHGFRPSEVPSCLQQDRHVVHGGGRSFGACEK